MRLAHAPAITKALRTFGLFLLLVVVLFGVLNYQAFYSQATYSVSPPTIRVQHQTSNTQLFTNGIVIPSIGVDAPIVWDIPLARTNTYLSQGVVHASDTAHPGQPGNMVLTGHSSDYPWKRHPFRTVFALTSRLKSGDVVLVTKDSVRHAYTVYESKIVDADDNSVLTQGTEKELTLVTCYPLGTTWKRLIVRARDMSL